MFDATKLVNISRETTPACMGDFGGCEIGYRDRGFESRLSYKATRKAVRPH